MDLRYSRHAVRRMIEQGITEGMVESVLLQPQWTPAVFSGIRYDGMVGERRLGVVVAGRDEQLVVTAFWVWDEE